MCTLYIIIELYFLFNHHISWLSTGTTVLQIYHKFLNHVSLALTMEVLLSTCFVTPRFKFFTLTVSVDYYVKKKKKTY